MATGSEEPSDPIVQYTTLYDSSIPYDSLFDELSPLLNDGVNVSRLLIADSPARVSKLILAFTGKPTNKPGQGQPLCHREPIYRSHAGSTRR